MIVGNGKGQRLANYMRSFLVFTLQLASQSLGEALGGLTSQFAELRKHLYTEDGKLRAFVNVYLNDEDIRYLKQENTPTKDGDTISIIPSIAGGSF